MSFVTLGAFPLKGASRAPISRLTVSSVHDIPTAPHLSETDPLTEIPSHRAFDAALEMAMSVESEPLTVALLQLDGFHAYESEHGDAAGARLLRAVAAAWHDAVGDQNVIARWSADQFAALLPQTDPVAALRAMHTLRAVLPSGVTCSVGVSPWDGSASPATLMVRADHARHRAAASGGDRVVLAR